MAFKIREVEILVECFWCVPSSEFPYSLISFFIISLFLCVKHSFLIKLEVILQKKKIGNSQVGISSEFLVGRKLHLIYHSVPFITEGKLFNTQYVSGIIWSREEPMARQLHDAQEDGENRVHLKPLGHLADLQMSRFHSQRRQWHPTPVLLPGKSQGRRSLVGCSPWGR